MSLQNLPPNTHLAAKKEYRSKVIKYASEHTWTFGRDQILFPVIMFLIGLPFWIHYGVFASLGAAKGLILSLVYSSVVGFIFLFIVNLFRAPFALGIEQSQRIASLEADLLTDKARQLPTHSATTQSKPERLEPNIVYLRAECVVAHVGIRGEAVEGEYHGNARSMPFDNNRDKNFVALVACFCNKPTPERKLGGLGNVSARITYSSPDWAEPIEIIRGAWLSEEDRRVVFGVNDTHRLIMAIAYGEQLHVHAVSRDSRGSRVGVDIRAAEIHGQFCAVQVQLIFENDGSILNEFEFRLTITREPEFDIQLVEAKQVVEQLERERRLETAQKLNEYLQEGNRILRGGSNVLDGTKESGAFWAAEVSAYIRTRLGEFHFIEFNREAGIKPYPLPAVNRHRVDWLYTRLERLGDIITELRKG